MLHNLCTEISVEKNKEYILKS